MSSLAFGAARHSLIIIAVAAFLLAFAAAFFDVAFNAWQIDRFRSVDTDYAVALSVLGFRCAMLVSGGIAIFYATSIGWAASLTGIALIALLLVSTIKIDESPLADTADKSPLADTGRTTVPMIDPAYFVNTAATGNAQFVWTGRNYAPGASGAWYVGFVNSGSKSNNNGVRLVRAGQ